MTELMTKAAVAGLLVCAMTGASFADVLAVANRGDQASGTNTTFEPVPLKDNDADTLNFTTTQDDELVVFTYNAECSAGGNSGYTAVRIVVDGNKIAKPDAGTNFAMCSAEDGFVAAVRQSYLKVTSEGAHSVRVEAARVGSATSWRLDDTTLVVEN